MIALIHPTGNQNVRAVLRALHARGSLAVFATGVGHGEEAAAPRWLPPRWREEWGRRSYSLPSALVWPRRLRETVRLASERARLRPLIRHETGWACVDAVYRDLDAHVARRLLLLREHNGVTALYGYEDGCSASFRRARELGLRRVYDLPIAYWETARRLLAEEAARLPEWRCTLTGMSDSSGKLERKAMELELADVVVCPSRFVADSLPGPIRATRTVVVAPFGSPPPAALAQEETPHRPGAPLRVLFAGSMGQRKGLADLFAAVGRLNRSDVQLVVLGSPLAPPAFYRRHLENFIHEPPRPHAEVLRLMRSCDVLALPSIVEGRALVLQEAMSQRLPLLITPNTGGSDLIEPGATGFLVPPGSPEAIAERIAWFADHRAATAAMGRQAATKAAAFTWDAYGAIVADAAAAERGQPA